MLYLLDLYKQAKRFEWIDSYDSLWKLRASFELWWLKSCSLAAMQSVCRHSVPRVYQRPLTLARGDIRTLNYGRCSWVLRPSGIMRQMIDAIASVWVFKFSYYNSLSLHLSIPSTSQSVRTLWEVCTVSILMSPLCPTWTWRYFLYYYPAQPSSVPFPFQN